MRKLKLDVDALRVESFEAVAGNGRLGTVRGNVVTPDCSEAFGTCPGFTCFDDTCGCADTSPRPSCQECSFYEDCVSVPPQCD